jgi:tetratricopeptide (TPR) repeat protein
LLNDESHKNEEAAELYKRVIKLDPTHEGANFFLGNYYLHIRDYRKASKHYETVMLYTEKNIPAHVFNLAARVGDGASDKELIELIQQITDRVPNMLAINRLQILLLALSKDASVRDSEQAKNMAEQLYKLAQYPVNMELLALTSASAGDFDLAVQQMQKAVAAERQYKHSSNLKRMQETLLLLQNKKLPELQWQQEIMHMQPPPTHALASFRDYPDANPI